MPSWLREALDYIAKEGRVSDAPIAFTVFVLLGGLALWAALSWKFDAQLSSRDAIISSRDATIRFQEGLISEYRNRVQIPEAGEDRKLAPEQRRILAREFRLKADKFKVIVIYAVSEREPRKYAKEFADLIRDDAGIKVVQREISSTQETEIGLFVGVRNLASPSDEAKEFMQILTKANLIAHYTTFGITSSEEEAGETFDLFVAKPSW
jgi:hypothetical protein